MQLKQIILFSSFLFLLGSGDAESGKDKTQSCIACHGQDGNSIVGLWPSLAGQNSKYLYKQLLLIKTGSRQVDSMLGILDSLSDQDLKDIAEYYSSQKNTIGAVAKTQLDLGKKLYYSGNLEKGIPACSACHSPRGLGNSQAAYPLLSGQQPDYVAKALKDYRSGARDNEDPSKIMVAIAYKLDDKEIEALSSFVHGLH
tara:strand:+ start:2549 stop:3145 length:597 start_codon:yes stop_codon:yes gene_type:complete